MAEYTGLTLVEVREMEYIQYLILRRDAYIYMLSRTEAGQEYLDNAWRREQTEPDRAGLRAKLGRKEAPSNGE